MMKNTNKRWPSVLLTVLMAVLMAVLLAVLVTVGLTAAAEGEPNIIAGGYCGADDTFSQAYGTNASWTLDDRGLLTISGEGAVYGRVSAMGDTPWHLYSYGGGMGEGKNIKYLKIESGITNVPAAVCLCNRNLLYAEIPDTVTRIGEFAFYGCEKLTYITIPKSVTVIENSAFNDAEGYDGTLKDVYFTGSEEEWNKIDIGQYNDNLLLAKIHFNSEGPQPDNGGNDNNTDDDGGFFGWIQRAMRGLVDWFKKLLRFLSK